MSGGPSIEILDGGTGAPPPDRGSAAGRLAGVLARLGPRARRRLAVAGVVAAGAVVVAAGAAAVRSMPPDAMPALAVVPEGPSALDPLFEQAPPWRVGADGRPQGPAVLTGRVTVRRPPPTGARTAAAADVETRVLGLAGPGVVRNASPPVVVLARGEAVPVTVRAVLDCEQVPDVPAGDAYRLLADAGRRGSPGGDRRRATLDAGQSGYSWAVLAQSACSAWRARTDLTVTAVTARVDASRPQADLRLTVRNAGHRAATLYRAQARQFSVVDGGLPVVVEPGAVSVAPVTVAAIDCRSSDRGPTDGAGTGALGVVARSGPSTRAFAYSSVESTGPALDGMALAPGAQRDLEEALDRMCGRVRDVTVQVSRGGLRYDDGTRALSVQVELTAPRGRVTSVTFVPAGDDVALLPLPTGAGALVPDASGTVRTTLRYQVAQAPWCEPDGPALPVSALLRVQDGAAVRSVPVSQDVPLGGDPALRRRMCPA